MVMKSEVRQYTMIGIDMDILIGALTIVTLPLIGYWLLIKVVELAEKPINQIRNQQKAIEERLNEKERKYEVERINQKSM